MTQELELTIYQQEILDELKNNGDFENNRKIKHMVRGTGKSTIIDEYIKHLESNQTTKEKNIMTQETKNTPAPWTSDADKHDAPYQNFDIKGGEFNHTIARVFQDDACFDLNPEQKANAKLIAAAPELLKACEDIIIAFESGCVEMSNLRLIKKAIKKAGGRIDD